MPVPDDYAAVLMAKTEAENDVEMLCNAIQTFLEEAEAADYPTTNNEPLTNAITNLNDYFQENWAI